MAFRILPTKEFSIDFSKLDKQSQQRVRKKVEELAQDPTRYKRLHYDLLGSCRLRVGKLRIIFSYSIEKNEVYLEKVVLRHGY